MNKKRDLLKEAIADAKQLKQTAIANAKLSLEESFQPHIQNMFSSKLAEMEKEEVNEEDELNLDELIAELEGGEIEEGKKKELDENEEVSEVEGEETETDGDEAEEEEIDLEDMTAEDLKDFVKGAVEELVAAGEIDLNAEPEVEGAEEVEESADEDIDIDELLAEIKKEKKTAPLKEKKEVKKLEEKKDEKELDEALKTVEKLKETLNEVNLLNSKLLYVNKMFKGKNLNESQKNKIIDSLDKAKTTKEAKLIYESLKVGFDKKPMIKKPIGSASKAIALKEQKEIIQPDKAVERMQRLAGLID